MPRKQSEWNKTVKRVFSENKGKMVNGKPYSLGDAMKDASKLKKGKATVTNGKTRRNNKK
jgi:hypothetical protein